MEEGGSQRGGKGTHQQSGSRGRQYYGQHGGNNRFGRAAKPIAKQRVDHAGVSMAGQKSDCLICCQHSDLFGIGECMHPICMECALRMRVVDDSRQCTQCRAEIQTLYFICAPPGKQLLLRIPSHTIPHPDEQKYGVKFDSQYAIDCFNAYMANQCAECLKRGEKVTFSTFAELRLHMSQVHQLSFCHICCDNLNVLTKDRRLYTRVQLQQHMAGRLQREKDGFRGHPTCKFCEQRFYDDEQQYRHLRKEHYFCQFCDQDGLEQNVFYKNQHQLNQHNRKTHHPCTDTECLSVGIVFRTDTELDVHRAKQHRMAQGGNRAIPLDIKFSRSGYTRGSGTRSTYANGERDENGVPENNPPAVPEPPVVTRIVPSAQHQQSHIVRSAFIPVQSNNDFPSLPLAAPNPPPNRPYGAPPSWTPPLPQQNRPHQTSTSRQLPLQSGEQFPTLGGAPSSSAQQQNNCVWTQNATKELFKAKAKPPKVEEPKRPKFVPSPECWPEGMREQLKARELGLPDPDPVVPPQWLNLNPHKEKKKKKSKTVPVSQMIANNIATESAKLAASSSSKFKFSTLAELADSIDSKTTTTTTPLAAEDNDNNKEDNEESDDEQKS